MRIAKILARAEVPDVPIAHLNMSKTKSKNKLPSRTNPNGANQWHADPRQQLFLAYYKDPTSPTFSNARQSALRAGFAEEYANAILAQQPAWLSEFLGSISPLLIKAEQNLQEFLDLPNETPAVGMYGPVFEKVKVPAGTFKNGKPKFKTVKKPVMQLNPKVMQIKQSSTHFVAETVGKTKYGKRATEGGDTFNILILNDEQRRQLAERIIKRRQGIGARSEGSSD